MPGGSRVVSNQSNQSNQLEADDGAVQGASAAQEAN